MTRQDIASVSRTQTIIKKYNFHLKKSFGQNFLVDLNVLDNIVKSADITEETGVIEIGPGIGALTEQLAKKAKKVVAYEIDNRLIPILGETLENYNNVTIINQDILKANVKEMIENEFKGYEDIAVVANLPYYITTPILMGLIEKNLPINRYCVMMQKEVAKRLSGGPNTKEYNSLTIAVNYYTVPKIVLNVPKTVFIPKPNVDSAVIRLDRREHPPVQVIDESFFFKVVRGSFIQRRKTIYNNLKQSLSGIVSTDQIKESLMNAEIKENQRGESLTIEQFAKLSNELYNYID